MAKDILSEYGPESKSGDKRATSGGVKEVKELPYSPPVGPKNKTDVGASGTNHGCCGTQGKH